MRALVLTRINHSGAAFPAGRKADIPDALAPGFLEAGAIRPLTEGEAADEAETIARIEALQAEIAALKAKPKA